jgi:hypothetical protein
MATTGLVNLAESLLNQTATAQELQAVPATNGTGTATAGAVNTQAILDEFVPSSQTGAANATAEAAGLFTAAQFPCSPRQRIPCCRNQRRRNRRPR